MQSGFSEVQINNKNQLEATSAMMFRIARPLMIGKVYL
jgi:2-methylaconitate cis-trans-isomerase PrpF